MSTNHTGRVRATWIGVFVGLLLGSAVLAGCGTTSRQAGSGTSHHPTAPSSTGSSGQTTTSAGGTPTARASGSAGEAPYTGPTLTSVDSVSCADATHCWASAAAGTSGDESAILVTSNGGSSWTVQQMFPGVSGISLDCSSDSHCLAAGGGTASGSAPLLLSTTDGGRTWSTQTAPGGNDVLDAMSCANALDCWLVGELSQSGADVIWGTTDGGGTWTIQNRAAITVSMGVGFGLSCPTAAHCVVGGVGALTTSDGGTSWQKHSVPGELNVIDCPSVSDCVAEGDVTSADPSNESTTLAMSNDGGSTWTDVGVVGGDVGVLGGLSCPTTSDCVAVGSGYTPTTTSGEPSWGAVETTTDGGSTWSGTRLAQASNLFAVSCAAGTSDCLAVGYFSGAGTGPGTSGSTGIILRSVDDGLTWSPVPLP